MSGQQAHYWRANVQHCCRIRCNPVLAAAPGETTPVGDSLPPNILTSPTRPCRASGQSGVELRSHRSKGHTRKRARDLYTPLHTSTHLYLYTRKAKNSETLWLGWAAPVHAPHEHNTMHSTANSGKRTKAAPQQRPTALHHRTHLSETSKSLSSRRPFLLGAFRPTRTSAPPAFILSVSPSWGPETTYSHRQSARYAHQPGRSLHVLPWGHEGASVWVREDEWKPLFLWVRCQ